MKKSFCVFWMILPFLFFLFGLSCKKEITNAATFAGHYKGMLQKLVNAQNSLYSFWEMQLEPSVTYNQLKIIPSPLVTSLLYLKGKDFTIDATVIGNNGTVEFVEYGSGTFTGNAVSFELHQDQRSLNDRTVMHAITWKGILYRQ